MTIPLFQQFQLRDTIEHVRVTCIPESNGDSSCFVTLKDIQVYFPNAQTFKLDGATIPFQEDSNGHRLELQFIEFSQKAKTSKNSHKFIL